MDPAESVRVRPKAGVDGWEDAASAPRDGRIVEVFFAYGSRQLRKWDMALQAWTEPGNAGTSDSDFTLWRPSHRDIATYVSVPRQG